MILASQTVPQQSVVYLTKRVGRWWVGFISPRRRVALWGVDSEPHLMCTGSDVTSGVSFVVNVAAAFVGSQPLFCELVLTDRGMTLRMLE